MIPNVLHIFLRDSSIKDSQIDSLIEFLCFNLRILRYGVLLEEIIGFIQMRHSVGESSVNVESNERDLRSEHIDLSLTFSNDLRTNIKNK